MYRNLLTGIALTLAATNLVYADAPKKSAGHAAELGISGNSVKQAIKKLGLAAEEYKDAKGNPHFVFKDKLGSEKAVAIFMEDCKAGRCEDVTFYADFGPVAKLTSATLNEWNHIGSKLRSKAFRSSGVDNMKGSVGLSSTVSYVGDKNPTAIGMQLGLFLAEVKMFSATIAKL